MDSRFRSVGREPGIARCSPHKEPRPAIFASVRIALPTFSSTVSTPFDALPGHCRLKASLRHGRRIRSFSQKQVRPSCQSTLRNLMVVSGQPNDMSNYTPPPGAVKQEIAVRGSPPGPHPQDRPSREVELRIAEATLLRLNLHFAVCYPHFETPFLGWSAWCPWRILPGFRGRRRQLTCARAPTIIHDAEFIVDQRILAAEPMTSACDRCPMSAQPPADCNPNLTENANLRR